MVFLLDSVARYAWCARAISLAVSTNADGRDALLIAFFAFFVLVGSVLCRPCHQSKPAPTTLEGLLRENSPFWDGSPERHWRRVSAGISPLASGQEGKSLEVIWGMPEERLH